LSVEQEQIVIAIRQRAIHAEDKQQRRDAILDAAEQLLQGAPERVASVAEVATQAGLAKGTVYLYFPSKEELLLAVHERRLGSFMRDLIDLIERQPRVDFDAVFGVMRTHLLARPLFLPLAARCLGLMAHSLPPAVALAFKQRMAAHLERAGAGIERHFPDALAIHGHGVVLLSRSYALTLGLWQMSAAISGGTPRQQVGPEVPAVFAWSFPEELELALRALWQGVLGPLVVDGATDTVEVTR
jgi:AcrR family transcriptional regulator